MESWRSVGVLSKSDKDDLEDSLGSKLINDFSSHDPKNQIVGQCEFRAFGKHYRLMAFMI
ncbi:hypothetical protein [Metamycoplasma hominis]|uniref:hypothetical protein n=1 Tax=Metamycoplasma hominis TaxID=2098 RepID=UPI001E5D71A5|nr:hypothetical protein [Metamycoplasma hominis]